MKASGRKCPDFDLEECRKAAAAGDPMAQRCMGNLYETGTHVIKNYTMAAEWYQLAAEKGVAEAQYNLGAMLARGVGVKQDLPAALDFFNRAAAQKWEPETTLKSINIVKTIMKKREQKEEKPPPQVATTTSAPPRSFFSTPSESSKKESVGAVASAPTAKRTPAPQKRRPILSSANNDRSSKKEIHEAESGPPMRVSKESSHYGQTSASSLAPMGPSATSSAKKPKEPEERSEVSQSPQLPEESVEKSDTPEAREEPEKPEVTEATAKRDKEYKVQPMESCSICLGPSTVGQPTERFLYCDKHSAHMGCVQRARSLNLGKRTCRKCLILPEEQCDVTIRRWLRLHCIYNKGDDKPWQSVMRDEDVSDMEEVLCSLREEASRGVAEANFILGMIYSREHGAPNDDALAFKYFDDGARKGDARSMHRLGDAHFEGRGTPQEKRTAMQWYRKAADLGLADAQCTLGELYATGRGGVPQDDAEAVKWTQMAVAQDFPDALCILGVLTAKGQGLLKNIEEGLAMIDRAREQGCELAKTAEFTVLNEAAVDQIKKSANTPLPADSKMIPDGCCVEIRGLEKKTELNGRIGYVDRFIKEAGRFAVIILDGFEGPFLVRRKNLMVRGN